MASELTPQLAATITTAPGDKKDSYHGPLEGVTFPKLASVKLDGIRGIVRDGRVYSRKAIMLPNRKLQSMFGKFENMDGEFILRGEEREKDVYNRTQSVVMSIDKEDELEFRVFDTVHPRVVKWSFEQRLKWVHEQIANYAHGTVHQIASVVEHTLVNSLDEMLEFEEDALEEGYEGIMLRDPMGGYKNGYSTFKQQWLLKLKRFEDVEGVVTGFIEQMTNTNEAQINELGKTKRSKSMAGLVPADTLGKLRVEVIFRGEKIVVEAGCGIMKHDERKQRWEHLKKGYTAWAGLGNTCTLRHFPHGALNTMRMPRFHGWRSHIDMGVA